MDDVIAIPNELWVQHININLHMDSVIVSGRVFLASVSKPIYYHDAPLVKSKKTKDFYNALDTTIHKYNHAGFQVQKIHCNNEYKSLMEPVKDKMSIDIGYAAPGEHESAAERNNRTIQEWYWTAFHRTSFKSMPVVMIDSLIHLTTKRLNMFPAKNGISSQFSPSAIMGEPPLDYNKHLNHIFGEYVQAHLHCKPMNDNTECTVDGIYLYPTDTGHKYMNLNTGQAMTRQRMTSVPMPNTVSEKVNNMALKQGIKEVKFLINPPVLIYPILIGLQEWIIKKKKKKKKKKMTTKTTKLKTLTHLTTKVILMMENMKTRTKKILNLMTAMKK